MDAETRGLAELKFRDAMLKMEYYVLTGKDQYKAEHMSALKNLAVSADLPALLRSLFCLFSLIPDRIMGMGSLRDSDECLEKLLEGLNIPNEVRGSVRAVGGLMLAGDLSRVFDNMQDLENLRRASEERGLDEDSRIALQILVKGLDTYLAQLERLDKCLRDPMANINLRREGERAKGRRVQELQLDEQIRKALMWLFRYDVLSLESLAQRMRLPFKDVVDVVQILTVTKMVEHDGNLRLTGVGRFYATCAVGFKIDYRMQQMS